MRKLAFLAMALLGVMLSCNLPFGQGTNVPPPSSSPTPALSSQQQEALERLSADSQAPPEVSAEYEIPRYITMELPAASTDPLEAAWIYFETYADLYGLRDPRNELIFQRPITSAVGTAMRFSQELHGLPVYASDIIVHINPNGLIHTVNGAVQPWVEMEIQPRLRAAEAVSIAAQDAGDPSLVGVGEPALTIYSPVVLALSAEKPLLVWQINLGYEPTQGRVPVYIYLVDAMTGTVVLAEPLGMPVLNAQILDDQNTTVLPGGAFQQPATNNPCMTVQNGNITQNNCPNDAEVQAAFNNLNTVWSYFENTFGRNGPDGAGLNCNVYVHYDGNNLNNAASWGGVCLLVFGDAGQPAGQGTASFLDIVAHEYTHSVTSFTAQLGLNGQPRTLNEHFSDLFGAGMIEGDWVMDSPLGVWRDMCTPPNSNQPDHMNGLTNSAYPDTGIPNKAACLATLGGEHNDFSIIGIGPAKTSLVWFTALTGGFVAANTNLNGFDNAILGSAQQLGNQGTLTQNDVCQVRNALASVGLGNAGDCDQDGTSDDQDTCKNLANANQADGDNDGRGDACDNCSQTANADQADIDLDGVGDACDVCAIGNDQLDSDNDNIPSACDNCPQKSNKDQHDTDFDGAGDVCDSCPIIQNADQSDIDQDGIGDTCDTDDDGDGRADLADNCPAYSNADQNDADNDGVGDTCDICPANPNSDQQDEDGDGVGDACDNCPEVSNPAQFDLDEDGKGNFCDVDVDGDGIPNDVDDCAYGLSFFGACGPFDPALFYEIPDQWFRIPIDPCLTCPWEIRDDWRARIVVYEIPRCMREIRLVEDKTTRLASSTIPLGGEWPEYAEFEFQAQAGRIYELLLILAEGSDPRACNAGVSLSASGAASEQEVTPTPTATPVPQTPTFTPLIRPTATPTRTSTPVRRPSPTPTSTPRR